MNNENNKLIGREELLETYVRYVRHRGDARVILKQRLDAIVSAFNPGMGKNVLNYLERAMTLFYPSSNHPGPLDTLS